jgi:hypothetical protein
MKIGAKSGKATTKVKKTTKPEIIVARQSSVLGSLAFRRVLVAEQAMFRDLRELIERIGNRTDNEKVRSYADKVAKCLGEMAIHLEYLQSFVPKGSPGDAALSIIDEALSIIEDAALEHVSELIGAIEITCLSSVLFGYELAGDPRSLGNIKKFQKEQAKRAREGRKKKRAASQGEHALNAAIEEHLGEAASGRDHKDANSILDLVNGDLEKAGHRKVSVDTLRRRIEKRRAPNRAL